MSPVQFRLREYAQYCQHVATIPHFKEFPQHLVQVNIHTIYITITIRDVNSHSFFANPDPAVLLNLDPDPADKLNKMCEKLPYQRLEKTKDCSKVKNYRMELFNIYGTSFKKKYYKYYRTYFLPFFLFSLNIFPSGFRSGSAY